VRQYVCVQPQQDTADEPATLQSRLEDDDRSGSDDAATAAARPTIADPVALLGHLHASGRFHRDSGFGRLFHRGMVSLRENVANESLHVSVHGNRVAAHVDEVSPLDAEAQGPSRYSVRRALLHNLVGMAGDLVWLLRGRQGDHSCVLDCEWVAPESQGDSPGLLDPGAAAWSVQLEARVAGTLDEARLRAAMVAALCARRPPPRELLDVVEARDDDALDAARVALQSKVIGPTDAPPLRACLARRPGGDVLMLNLNSAAVDGVAAMAVLHAIARTYAGAGEPPPGLDFLTAHELPVRPASPSMSILARVFKRMVEWLRDRLARPGRLAAEGAVDRAGYGYHMVALSAAETEHAVAGTGPGTERNVLTAALHRAIGDWNRQPGTPGRRIGVLVPVNLRPPDWPQGTIGNFSVTARLSTNRRERSSPASALHAINAQRARNKRTRTGIALIAGLQRSGLLSLWAKQSSVVLQPLTGNRQVDTAMLCDMGWIDEAPAFGPDAGETLELWFSAPARSPLSLCVGAVTAGERLHLTFRYPHNLFSADAARRFAACYLDHVRAVAGSRS
jgi:hypothetical protein